MVHEDGEVKLGFVVFEFTLVKVAHRAWFWEVDFDNNFFTGGPCNTMDVRTGGEIKDFPFLSRNFDILLTDLSNLAGLLQPIIKS